jgi:hypothetical protein
MGAPSAGASSSSAPPVAIGKLLALLVPGKIVTRAMLTAAIGGVMGL